MVVVSIVSVPGNTLVAFRLSLLMLFQMLLLLLLALQLLLLLLLVLHCYKYCYCCCFFAFNMIPTVGAAVGGANIAPTFAVAVVDGDTVSFF